ncbi:KAP family P-loop NTPase fold protein, partial [Escherichia coli]|uniref:KAP family P-loop NTPase fold protein n=1 Tax=Escherichia coli TaxID=562 RepID=UPI0010CB5E71
FENGFDITSDIFNRKTLYDQMIRLIINAPDSNLVFALDDIWGSGKTSFVKMLKSELELTNSEYIDVVYFDAFENDYQSDPFISISSELYNLLKHSGVEAEDVTDRIIKTGKKIGAKILIGGAKVAITTLTAGVVNGSALDEAGKTVSDSINSELESFVEEKIKSMEQEKNSIADFKKALEEIYTNTKRKTLIIIDELDRARPDYSLELLEKIKHLFSVKGMVFLLVMNREQFEKGIAYKYGDINTGLYLNKFIHYWFSLPKINMYDSMVLQASNKTTITTYIKKTLQQNHSLGINTDGAFVRVLSCLIETNNCSLREVERCISTMLVVDNHTCIANNDDNYYMIALALVCFLKVTSPDMLNRLLKKEMSSEEILELLNIKSDYFSSKTEIKLLKELLDYYYIDKETLKLLRNEKGSYVQRIEGDFAFEYN